MYTCFLLVFPHDMLFLHYMPPGANMCGSHFSQTTFWLDIISDTTTFCLPLTMLVTLTFLFANLRVAYGLSTCYTKNLDHMGTKPAIWTYVQILKTKKLQKNYLACKFLKRWFATRSGWGAGPPKWYFSNFGNVQETSVFVTWFLGPNSVAQIPRGGKCKHQGFTQ